MKKAGWPKGKPRVYLPEGWDFWLGALPDQELADLLGCDRRAVSTRRREAGLPPATRAVSSKTFARGRNNDMVRDLLPRLQNINAVAAAMGVTRQRVSQIAERAGVKWVRVWIA